MSYIAIHEISFCKFDDNDECELDEQGNVVIYKPKGRMKALEYLLDGSDVDDFEKEDT